MIIVNPPKPTVKKRVPTTFDDMKVGEAVYGTLMGNLNPGLYVRTNATWICISGTPVTYPIHSWPFSNYNGAISFSVDAKYVDMTIQLSEVEEEKSK